VADIPGFTFKSHIQQRANWDCGVAAIAIVAGLQYDHVAKLVPCKRPRGLSQRRLLKLLKSATGMEWRDDGQFFCRVESWANSDCPLLLTIKRPWRWWWHYIAVHRGWVYDPNYDEGCPVQFYDRRHYRAWVVMRPDSPDRLMGMHIYSPKTKQAGFGLHT
jgi:hypothetical protein